MAEKRPGAVFNIGSQQGNINNVAGDMTHHGDQMYVAAPVDEVRHELAKIQAVLAAVNLDGDIQERVQGMLGDADRELNDQHPDKNRIGARVERLTRLLKEAGAISAAGSALVEPLQRIASWLGASGLGIIRLIT